jgi:hypothetical protein
MTATPSQSSSEIEASVGASLAKIVADAGYRGRNASKEKAFKAYVAGQKRGLSAAISAPSDVDPPSNP